MTELEERLEIKGDDEAIERELDFIEVKQGGAINV